MPQVPKEVEVPGDEPRVTGLYRRLYGRAPDRDELELGLRFVAAPEPAAGTGLSRWERYAQVLLLANEFAFID